MDAVKCKEIRNKLDSMLKDIEVELGVVIKIGKMLYTAESINIPLTVLENGDPSMSADQVAFNLYCERYGLKPEHFGKKFIYNKLPSEIIGIDKNAKKYPIFILCNGNRYKISARDAKESLDESETK